MIESEISGFEDSFPSLEKKKESGSRDLGGKNFAARISLCRDLGDVRRMKESEISGFEDSFLSLKGRKDLIQEIFEEKILRRRYLSHCLPHDGI